MMRENYQCQYCGKEFEEGQGLRIFHERCCSENPEFQKSMIKENPSLTITKKYHLGKLLK